MRCRFCGKELSDKPIRQSGQIFCSNECIKLANDIALEEANYLEDQNLEYNPDNDTEYYEGDEGMPY